MKMKPAVRKLALTAHVVSSVGWLGAALGYIALAATCVGGGDAAKARGAYLSMESIGWFVLVPCSVAALVTGLIQSLGTEWGLIRHRWILAKLLLTVPATAILLLHMPSVSRAAKAVALGLPAGPSMPLLVHAVGGAIVLLGATVLSIYKPWGRTGFGRSPQPPAV
jgi:hypothetical protein